MTLGGNDPRPAGAQHSDGPEQNPVTNIGQRKISKCILAPLRVKEMPGKEMVIKVSTFVVKSSEG